MNKTKNRWADYSGTVRLSDGCPTATRGDRAAVRRGGYGKEMDMFIAKLKMMHLSHV
jgi:hypothetical protein